MALDRNERVSAQVLLRSASGRAPDPNQPITAETIATFAPATDAVARVTTYFRSRAFEVGPVVGISFAVTGTVAQFEDVFETTLRRTERKGIAVAGDDASGLELPLEPLPATVREAIAAVTFTPPPDFGPGNP